MSDLDLRLLARRALREGRGADLACELLSAGRWTPADLDRFRRALDPDPTAWCLTPHSPPAQRSRRRHAWLKRTPAPTLPASLHGAACGLALPATAAELAASLDDPWTTDRRCEGCASRLRADPSLRPATRADLAASNHRRTT